MPNQTDLEKTRSDLTLMRSKLGALTPAGRRCSNILEQLENMEKSTDRGQIERLRAAIKIQMDELAELTKGAG